MKKIIVLALCTSLSAFAIDYVKPTKKVVNKSNSDCRYGQCIKIKSDGYQCKNCATSTSSYCWSHSKF